MEYSPTVSILLLTIDRYDLTKEYVGKALKEAGYPFDLCAFDNGSSDPRVFELVREWVPKFHMVPGMNNGTPQALNKLILKNPSDYYVFIGNDIELPKNWLKDMMETITKIPESGVVGINWRPLQYETKTYNDTEVWHTERTFGTMMVSQALRDKIGKFCEDYGPYGLWDSDYSIRAQLAGFPCYYIKDLNSDHKGNDVGENSEYRRMKDESLSKAKPIFEANHALYLKGEKIYQ